MDEVDKERLPSALPSWQKIAVLMVALGDDLAAELMRQLNDSEATELTRAVVELKQVSKDVQDRVLVVFAEALKGEAPPSGGIDYAHQVLVRALGVERAGAMIERAAASSSPTALEFSRDSLVRDPTGRPGPSSEPSGGRQGDCLPRIEGSRLSALQLKHGNLPTIVSCNPRINA